MRETHNNYRGEGAFPSLIASRIEHSYKTTLSFISFYLTEKEARSRNFSAVNSIISGEG